MKNQDNIELQIIDTSSHEYFNRIDMLYLQAFEETERRESLKEVLKNDKCRVNAVIKDNSLAGFVTLWEFNSFLYVEHIATFPEFRNCGIGEVIFKKIMAMGKLLIAECEMAEYSVFASRRVEYYKRLGFLFNPYFYEQPSYGKGKAPVIMNFLSYPDMLSEEDFNKIRIELHQIVYGQV